MFACNNEQLELMSWEFSPDKLPVTTWLWDIGDSLDSLF